MRTCSAVVGFSNSYINNISMKGAMANAVVAGHDPTFYTVPCVVRQMAVVKRIKTCIFDTCDSVSK